MSIGNEIAARLAASIVVGVNANSEQGKLAAEIDETITKLRDRERLLTVTKTDHDEDCICQRCTERLLKAHRAHLEAWRKEQRKR